MAKNRAPIIAVVLGLVTAGIAFWYFGNLKKQAEIAQVKNVKILIAAVPIPARTIVKEEMIAEKELPETAVTVDMITDKKEVIGKVTNSAIITGENLLRPRFGEKGAGMGLAFIVPKGKRAITITVGTDTGIAYLIRPGDVVDVISSFSIPRVSAEGKTTLPLDMSMTLIQNAQVLAIDQNMESAQVVSKEGEPANKPTLYTLVTLAVTPKDAERVHLLYQKGQNRLVLRPINDFAAVSTKGTSYTSLIGKDVSVFAGGSTSVTIKSTSESSKNESTYYPKKYNNYDYYPPIKTAEIPPVNITNTTQKNSTQNQTQANNAQTQKKPKTKKIQVIKGTTSEEVNVE